MKKYKKIMNIKNFRLKNFLFLLLIINLIIGPLVNKNNSVSANQKYSDNLSDYIKNIPKDKFYILGPGDTLSIKVTKNSEDLNKVFTINGEGIANLQRLKRIYVSGLTIGELTKILNKEYLNYVKNPSVELEILNYRPIKIFVDGEIDDPGLHILQGSKNAITEINFFNTYKNIGSQNQVLQNQTDNLEKAQLNNNYFPTLFDVIRKTGGITNYADLSKITIIRKNSISNGGGKIKTDINLLKAIELIDLTQNIRVMDGDSIFIPKSIKPNTSQISKIYKSNINPKFVEVMIRAPGYNELEILKLPKNSLLSDAVEITSDSFLRGPVRLIRYERDGTFYKRKFNFISNSKPNKKNNPYLLNGDIIILGNSKLKLAAEALNDITSPFRSIIITKEFIDIFN